MSFLSASGVGELPRWWALLSLLLRIPLALFFLWLAYKSLSGDVRMAADFQRWGYSEGFLRSIGAAQALGGLALLHSQTSFAGALLLGGVLLGAVYTHVRFDPPASAIPAALVLVAVGSLGVLYGPRGWL